MISGDTFPTESEGSLLLVECETSAFFDDIFRQVIDTESEESESELLLDCMQFTCSGSGEAGGNETGDGNRSKWLSGSCSGDSRGEEISNENSEEGGDEVTVCLPERVFASSEAAGFRQMSEWSIMATAADKGQKSEHARTESELFVVHTPHECEALCVAESLGAN
jgi:hypothetical protein